MLEALLVDLLLFTNGVLGYLKLLCCGFKKLNQFNRLNLIANNNKRAVITFNLSQICL